MSRLMIPPAALLLACTPVVAPSPLGVPLTDTCAVIYMGGTNLDIYANADDSSVALWMELPAPDVSDRAAGEAFSESLEVATDLEEFHLYTGENLRGPCSDLAMNEVRMADYQAVSGALELDYVMPDSEGTLVGGTVEPTFTELVVQNGDEDPLDYGELALGVLTVGAL